MIRPQIRFSDTITGRMGILGQHRLVVLRAIDIRQPEIQFGPL
jgi:hypothetical protein